MTAVRWISACLAVVLAIVATVWAATTVDVIVMDADALIGGFVAGVLAGIATGGEFAVIAVIPGLLIAWCVMTVVVMPDDFVAEGGFLVPLWWSATALGTLVVTVLVVALLKRRHRAMTTP